MSEVVCGLSERSLEGLWKVYGRGLEGVWRCLKALRKDSVKTQIFRSCEGPPYMAISGQPTSRLTILEKNKNSDLSKWDILAGLLSLRVISEPVRMSHSQPI